MSPGPIQPTQHTWLKVAQRTILFGILYFVADIALNHFAFSNGWTILWPLNGVTIAILLCRPRSEWPSILLGVGLGAGLAEWKDGNPAVLEAILRVFSLTEVFLSAVILPAFTTLHEWLRKPRIFWKFFAALLLGPVVSGIMAAIAFHLHNGQGYLSAFDDWAPSDALGIAVTMPFALSLRSPEMRDLFRRQAILKTIATLALCLACATAVFSVSRYPLLFLLYPALLFVDSVLAFSGSSIAVVGISLLSVYLTTKGFGPFGTWQTGQAISRDVALQIYLGFHLVAHFPASILFLERKRMASELRDTNAQLLMLASLDGLTGVANRRSLDEKFAQEWKRAQRLRTPLALIMIDIDHFKQFNDLYGHHHGDECLQAVAQALAGELRRPQDQIARFGGEEFALLLPHTDLEGALHMAEKLRTSIVDLAITHRGCAYGIVTVSIGCASFTPLLGEEKFTLLQMADAALYEAKHAGRNRVHA